MYIFGLTAQGEPKTELSYSGWRLWKENKEKYRDRYYRNIVSPDTAEMLFGKRIANILETSEEVAKNPLLKDVPRYDTPEYRIQVEVDGVKLNGFIDSFDSTGNRFLEYKTGHANAQGIPPWDAVKVAKHEQLPFYSLLISEKLGRVERKCHLVWLETEMISKEQQFQGQSFGLSLAEPRLTGKIQVFPRIIYKYELVRLRKEIKSVAEEIYADYQNYAPRTTAKI